MSNPTLDSASRIRLINPETDLDSVVTNDIRSFGGSVDVELARDTWASPLELDRFWVSTDVRPSGRELLVGHAGVFSLDLTMPGGRQVPMAGVTWVAVQATHRRQGRMRELMDVMVDDARDHGETMVGLLASEGSIYRNVGFATASYQQSYLLDVSKAAFLESRADTGSCRFVDDGAERLEIVADALTRALPGRVGDVSRPDRILTRDLSDHPSEREGDSPEWMLVHEDAEGRVDGVVRYRIASDWGDGLPRFLLKVTSFIALSADAERALWSTLCEVDLIGSIKWWRGPVDPLLGDLLANRRALTTTETADGMWLRILDVAAVLESRTYSVADAITFDLGDDGTWQLDGDTVGATCVRSTRTPDATLSMTDLASLVLGGGSAKRLQRSELLGATPEVAARIDAMFDSFPRPFLSSGF